MITLLEAAKAGAVCMSLLGDEPDPSVLFCTLGDQDLVCMDSKCQTESEFTVDWLRDPVKQLDFYKKLYGYKDEKK
jgi:hypothetical protein